MVCLEFRTEDWFLGNWCEDLGRCQSSVQKRNILEKEQQHCCRGFSEPEAQGYLVRKEIPNCTLASTSFLDSLRETGRAASRTEEHLTYGAILPLVRGRLREIEILLRSKSNGRGTWQLCCALSCATSMM